MDKDAIWNKIAQVKDEMELGNITRDEAKEVVEPLLAQLNKRIEEISKKYGKKARLLTFITAMNSPLLTRSVGETKAHFGSKN